MTKCLAWFIVLVALQGCIGIFANDFEVDYEAELLGVETVTDDTGTRVVCRMKLTATAVGDDGEVGEFGEADFAYRSLADGSYLGGERRSAAFMGSRFGSESIDAGRTLSTEAFQRSASEPFEWRMALYFRRPGGTRGNEELSIRCG